MGGKRDRERYREKEREREKERAIIKLSFNCCSPVRRIAMQQTFMLRFMMVVV